MCNNKPYSLCHVKPVIIIFSPPAIGLKTGHVLPAKPLTEPAPHGGESAGMPLASNSFRKSPDIVGEFMPAGFNGKTGLMASTSGCVALAVAASYFR